MNLSDQDRRLLALIQRDTNLSLAEMAEQTSMATSTVWRRLQEFDKSGLIRARVAVLDAAQVGAALCVFATVRLTDHSEAAIAAFAAIIRDTPQIMEAHAISGTADYLLKIRCADVADYESFLTHTLLRRSEVKSVMSSFSLKPLKETLAVPL